MRRRARRTTFAFDEFRRRRPAHLQYHGYPSKRALGLWEYVLQIGTSGARRGHRYVNPGLRRGYLLHYVRRGTFTHVVAGHTFTARKGEIVLLDFGLGHTQLNRDSKTTHLWWLLIDGKDMAAIFGELGADHDPIFRGVDVKRFESLFRDLWLVTSKPTAAHEAKAHALIHAILAELFATRPERAEGPVLIADKTKLSDNVRRAVNLLEMSFYMNIGLKQVETHVGTNMYHLAHKFREEVGVPPIQYLNRYRIEIAKRLLTDTGKSINDIARLVGIPDESYFSRTFRQHAGKTPKAFRASR